MEALDPCPFCGGEGDGLQVKESTHWTGQCSQVISATVIHWCKREPGQPQSIIQIKGKTREDAVHKWNSRVQS